MTNLNKILTISASKTDLRAEKLLNFDISLDSIGPVVSLMGSSEDKILAIDTTS